MDAGRRRQQRPCDNCRRRRIRCLFASDAATDCVLCVSRNTQCTYVQSASTKKRSTYASNGLIESSRAGANDRPRAHSYAGESSTLIPTNLPPDSLLIKTLGHQNRQSGQIVGSSGDFDLSLAASPWASGGQRSALKPPQTLRYANHSTLFIMTPDSSENIASEFSNLDEIEDFVKPHGPDLVSLYFRIVHPSFPILHKKVFLEKHGRSYRESTPVGLGAVYVMALNWWSYSSKLADLPKPNAKELENRVLRMLFDAHKRPKISDLQGALCLMQSPGVVSWTMIGHLLAMAQNLGINADATDWNVPDWERGVRKRVAWALYMQDQWGALIYGRASHIRPDDWDVQPLTDADFPETAVDDDDEEGSAEIEQGKHTFIYMVNLTKIVAQILDQFFTLKAAGRFVPLPHSLDQAKPLQLELRNWYNSLPGALSMEETVPRKLSSVGYLHLAYYTAEVTLHRAILRSCSYADPPPDMIAIARQAATARFTAALDFMKSLKGEHLQSFWYFSSSSSLTIIGLLAGILYATAPSVSADLQTDEQRILVKKLAEYRWTLRVSAKSADFIGVAVSLLDSRMQALEQQQNTSATNKPGALSDTMSPGELTSPDKSELYMYGATLGRDSVPQQSEPGPSQTWTQNFYDFGTPYTSLEWDDFATYAPPG